MSRTCTSGRSSWKALKAHHITYVKYDPAPPLSLSYPTKVSDRSARTRASRFMSNSVSNFLTNTEWQVPSQALPAHGIPLQATDSLFCNENLPPERNERRKRKYVPRHAPSRRMETQLEDRRSPSIRPSATIRADARRRRRGTDCRAVQK